MTRQPPTPRLQIALDTLDLPAALGPLQQAAPYVDVIECGTILVLCEGFHAVRAIRALFPDKQILADVRIAEAGSKIARLAFEAGADLVSCVAGASMSTIRQVCQVADELGGEVQVELADEWFDAERARAWRQAGVEHVIVKRSRDREASGDLSWKSEDMDRVDELRSPPTRPPSCAPPWRRCGHERRGRPQGRHQSWHLREGSAQRAAGGLREPGGWRGLAGLF